MRFEGSTSENPRLPKGLIEKAKKDRKPIGPFGIRSNAKEVAAKLGWRFARLEMTGMGKIWYVLPPGMNDDFEMIENKQNKKNSGLHLY